MWIGSSSRRRNRCVGRIGVAMSLRSIIASWICSVLLVSLHAADSKWTLRTAGGQPNLPPIPSIAQSPVKFLSDLLGATAEQRDDILAGRTPSRRAFWERKVREYEALPEVVRRARLRSAQLHWYLALLIGIPEESRTARIDSIPESDRVLVKRRMEQWDQLPADLRTDILANIKVMQYFARLVSSSPEQRAALMKTSSEASNPMNDKMLSWQTLSPQRRQQMFDAYARFYELPPLKQDAAIAKIPVPARKQLKDRLDELLRMPLDKQKKCLIALNAFAQMTPDERTIFRGNAERWRAMDAKERQFWTLFVKQLPPLPPMVSNRGRLIEDRGGIKLNTGASR